MKHVRIIAERPHPVSSEDHDRVRDYLMQVLDELDADPQIQRSESWNVWTNQPLVLQNIVNFPPTIEMKFLSLGECSRMKCRRVIPLDFALPTNGSGRTPA